ncbi:vesicle transport through interaction with t-SNAREs homolog 1A-like [Paramacrobiotus metropolitanus]|uniref:vesicle transport through interaction with t-SNAREs homolog 1A-like n=1 Tax=Paramacrobiotus metropolitanus TaxID=2943436 RepID=UPI0024465647|nr:vesicle transport through interaction with t-SNAREs homolog 1A-like [Paramacrobiotus metropolitanus]
MAGIPLLKDFEQQYAAITAEIMHKLSDTRYQSGGERRLTIREVERSFEECRELFEQMELEIRALTGEERAKHLNRLQSYKQQVNTLQQDLKELKNPKLADAHFQDAVVDVSDQRALLLERVQDSSDHLDRATRTLDQGYRVALETEQIGASVLNNLNTQRETLNKARSRMNDMEEDLGRSSRILTVMIRRVVQNRVLVVGIVAVLLIIIGICVYFGVRGSS